MRDIKFRAWDNDANTMATWDMIKDWVHAVHWDDMFCDASIVLEQFTGLLDKNGVEIYEGDICRSVWMKMNEIVISVVEYEQGGYVLVPKIYKNAWTVWLRCGAETDTKIIGNIHDNPELLKVK